MITDTMNRLTLFPLNKKALGWATVLASVTMCAITYGFVIRPAIKRRKTEAFGAEAAFLLQKMKEKADAQANNRLKDS